MCQHLIHDIRFEIQTQLDILSRCIADCDQGCCLEFVRKHASAIVQLCDAGIEELELRSSSGSGPIV